jgi:hypothetical protein
MEYEDTFKFANDQPKRTEVANLPPRKAKSQSSPATSPTPVEYSQTPDGKAKLAEQERTERQAKLGLAIIGFILLLILCYLIGKPSIPRDPDEQTLEQFVDTRT